MDLNIPVRPTSSIYSTYRRLSYKPWYAIAEFVDNSTQSYFNNREALLKQERGEPIRIDIVYDSQENSLEIIDNAFGMEKEDFLRAVILDSPPSNRTGRSEFGMGLKTAACWFGSKWSVESTQLGSDKLYRATVDVGELATSRAESIIGNIDTTDDFMHFTRIKIFNLYHPIRERTVWRIKEQLGSMYRQDIRSKEIVFRWNGTEINYEEQPILETVTSGCSKSWKKDVEFNVQWDEGGATLPVKGWIGIRQTGRQRDAGFVLMRRGRVIQGGPGEGYRPTEVFGAPNMFRSQRLIGELHLDEWPVTQAKDQFDWSNGLEDAFIAQLSVVSEEFGEFADNYRAPAVPRVITPLEMDNVTRPMREVVANPQFGQWIEQVITNPAQVETFLNLENNVSVESEHSEPSQEPIITRESDLETIQRVSDGPIIYSLNLDTTTWNLKVHWQSQIPDVHWLQIEHSSYNEINIFLNTAHPFVLPYLQERHVLEFFQKFIVAYAIAEKIAFSIYSDGRINPADFRILMNKILRRTAEMEVYSNA